MSDHMLMLTVALPTRVPFLLCAVVLMGFAGGCVSGSLATSTGDRSGGEWSIAPRQRVHVGETVRFSFVLKKPLQSTRLDAYGRSDYCVFDIGGDRYDVDLDEYGAFCMEYAFDDAKPGDEIIVHAIAYRQNTERDLMRIADSWIENESPHNEPDRPVAAATVRLTAYQSHVHMALPEAADEYDFSTARLTLHTVDGKTSAVFRNRPPRRGFELERRSGGEGWWVEYLPAGDEVSPYGETSLEFSVYDYTGSRHTFTDTLDTP